MDYKIHDSDIGILKKAGVSADDIKHCIKVAEKAMEIAERTGAKLDMELVGRGALFHDLGKAKTHEIEHGKIGTELGKTLGLPEEITAIMEKHIRGGLTEEEARELGLPIKDYTLKKLEERIVIYADRLVDIITDGIVEMHRAFALFSSTISKSPVLPLFASHLGADPSGVGFVASVSAFTGIIASIPAGLLSDRLGRKKMLIFSLIVFSTAPFLYLFINKIWQLAMVRFYHGFATAVFIPVAMALIADLFHHDRGEKMGWFSTSTLVGRFMAPIAGGGIIGAMVFNPGLGFRIVYLVCAAAGIIALILTSTLPSDSSFTTNHTGSYKTCNGKIFRQARKAAADFLGSDYMRSLYRELCII